MTTGVAFHQSLRRPARYAATYSVEYRRELRRAAVEIAMLARQAELPLPRLVWQARNAYAKAWAAECERAGHA